MKLKKSTIYKLLLLSSIGSLNAAGYWVKYGWEIFDHVTDARTAALGNTVIGYPLSSMGAYISNPAFKIDGYNIVGLTHQSRFAGMVNGDYVSPRVCEGLYERFNRRDHEMNIKWFRAVGP